MDKLVELFNFLKESDLLVAGNMHSSIAEMHLDNSNALDIHFLRNMLGENITKAQVHNAYYEVFGEKLPNKFTYIKQESTITKEDFLIVYEPAEYSNVREWIGYILFEYGHHLTRTDMFNWIMSTAKTRVFLGDISED